MSTVRAAIYARVSTAMQALEGESLEMQEARAREIAEQQGMTLLPAFVDVMSGKKDKRPALARLERDIRAGLIDTVICYRVDRLGRSRRKLYELLELIQQRGVRLISLTQQIDTSTAMGRMMLSLMIDLAVFEIEQLGERISDTMLHLAKQGRPVSGKAPFGYRYVPKQASQNEDGTSTTIAGRLEVEHQEAEVVREMFERYAAGASFASIAKRLNLLGVRTLEGRPWTVTSVKFVLLNPLYCGDRALRRWNGPGGRKLTTAQMLDRIAEWQSVQGDHEAIVSREVAERVRDRYQSERSIAPRARTAKNPWSGLVVCALCGNRMVAYYPTSSRRSSIAFRCRNRMMQACEGASLTINWLESDVLETVSGLLDAAGAVESAAEVSRSRKTPATPRASHTERQVAAKQRELQRLEFKFDHEIISGDVFLAERQRVHAELQALQSAPATATPARRLVLPRSFAETYRALGAAGYRVDDQRRLLRAAIERIEMGPAVGLVHLVRFDGHGVPQAVEVARWKRWAKRKPGPRPWSRTDPACVDCGTTERPHLAKGCCAPCYKRRTYHAARD